MIERYVFLRLNKEHAHERDLVIRETRRVLAALPHVQAFTVGAPADEHARAAWDVSIRVELASIDDVTPYLEDAAHQRFIDEFLVPRVHVIKAWNFSVE